MPNNSSLLSPLVVVGAFVLTACASQAGGFSGGGGSDDEGDGGAGGTGTGTGTATDTGTSTGTDTGTGTGTGSGTGTGTGTGTGMAGICGDGTCDAAETCTNCASDCGACPPICGDGTCEPGEEASCPQDCGGGACAHDPCVEGVALDPACDACADLVCFLDDYCCTVEWDLFCVDTAYVYCIC